MQFIIKSGVGVEEIDRIASGTIIYPNPVSDIIFIQQTPGSIAYENFEIFNAVGQCVLSGKMDMQLISFANLRCGIYILSLSNDKYIERIKIIKDDF